MKTVAGLVSLQVVTGFTWLSGSSSCYRLTKSGGIIKDTHLMEKGREAAKAFGGSLSPGVEFKNGKFYNFTAEKVSVIVSWPRPRALERPRASSEWQTFLPGANIFDVGKYRWALRKKTESARAGKRPGLSVCKDPEGQFGLAFGTARADDEREAQAYRRLFEPIPDDVIDAIGSYSERQWQMLSLIARCPGALELHNSNPALAFSIASNRVFYNRFAQRPLAQMRFLAGRKQRDALAWLGFPPTEAAVRVFKKIAVSDVNIPMLMALRKGMKSPQVNKLLAHLSGITPAVAHILGEPSLLALSSFRLIEELSVTGDNDASMQHLFRLRDVEEMSLRMKPVKSIVISSTERLFEVYEQMVEEINRVEREGLFQYLFPPAPLQGTNTIEPVESPLELLREGEAQHNCAAQYTGRVAEGKAYLYRVLAPERATICVLKKRRKWVLSEIKAACNRPVGFETAKAVTAWFIEASAQKKPLNRAVVNGVPDRTRR